MTPKLQFLSLALLTTSIYPVQLARAQTELPKYFSISSLTCEMLGYQSIYNGPECLRAARYMKYTYQEEFIGGDYPDIVDGCTILGDFADDSEFIIHSQSKGWCDPSHPYFRTKNDVHENNHCHCTRYTVCICKSVRSEDQCASGRFEYVDVHRYDGSAMGKRKYCVPLWHALLLFCFLLAHAVDTPNRFVSNFLFAVSDIFPYRPWAFAFISACFDLVKIRFGIGGTISAARV